MDIAGKNLIDSAVVWDLCAGSGAVGLEAMSWGASHCIFIDRNPRSALFIRAFLTQHDASDDATVITGDFKDYINTMDSVPDVVFIDPPYEYTRLYEWIDSLEWNSIMSAHGTVFVECGSETVMQKDWNRRKYGDSYLNWKKMKDVR